MRRAITKPLVLKAWPWIETMAALLV